MPQQRQRRSPPTHRWKTSFRCTNTLPTCATNKTSHTSSEAPRHPADSKWQLHGHRQHQSFRSTSFTTQRAHCVLIALTRGKCLLGSRRFLNLLYGTGLKKKKKYGDAPFAETLSRQCSCHQKGGITAHAGRLLRHSVVGEGRHSKLSTRRKKKTSTREREEARKVSSVLVVWPRRSNSSSSPKRITGRARRSQGIQ